MRSIIKTSAAALAATRPACGAPSAQELSGDAAHHLGHVQPRPARRDGEDAADFDELHPDLTVETDHRRPRGVENPDPQRLSPTRRTS
jgi:hypothetical protein